MHNYRLSSRAEQDLIDIYLYTLEMFGFAQAESYSKEITDVFGMLAANPRIGRPDPILGDEYRRHEHGSHVVFFSIDADGIVIGAVLNEGMCPELHL